MTSRIQDYDVDAADLYDDHSATFRILAFVLGKALGRVTLTWRQYREMELYCAVQSLQRKLNKLYHQRILVAHDE